MTFGTCPWYSNPLTPSRPLMKSSRLPSRSFLNCAPKAFLSLSSSARLSNSLLVNRSRNAGERGRRGERLHERVDVVRFESIRLFERGLERSSGCLARLGDLAYRLAVMAPAPLGFGP